MTLSPRAHAILALLARLLVGGIFLMAALPKIGAVADFANSVRAYGLLPSDLVLPFARIVPWLELLVALYLLAGFLTRIGALGAAVMLAMFTFALGHALATGNTNHGCGCFGSAAQANPIIAFLSGGTTITAWDVIRDGILLVLALMLLRFGPGLYSVDALFARRRDWPEPESGRLQADAS